MLCIDTQDGQVIVESSDSTQSTWSRNGQATPVSLPRKLHEQKQKAMMLEDEPLRSESIQNATEEEQRRSTSSSKANEVVGPKPKGRSAADVCGSERKVQCCKEKYCIGTWNVRSMYLGKLDVIKEEMARINIDIMGVSELKRTEMG